MEAQAMCADDTCLRDEVMIKEGGQLDRDSANGGSKDLAVTAPGKPGSDSATDKRNVKNNSNKNEKVKSYTSSSLIKTVHTQKELETLLSENSAIILEFMTSWCGACQSIEPLFEELSEANSDSVRAARVVCDKNRETKKLASSHGVSSYPVFLIFQESAVTSRWNGADRGKLEKAFERLAHGGRRKGRKGGARKKNK